MNFSINLATRVYVDFRKVNIGFLAAGLLLSIWLFFSIYMIVDNAAQLEKLAQYSDRLNRGTAKSKVSDSQYSAFQASVKTVNSILYKRSYDWLLLLSNLERLIPEGVSLRALEPSDKGATLKLSASARNFAAVRRFIENLEGSKVFKEVYLTDQTTVKEGTQKGLNFTVVCKVSAS
ncbi:MAG: PilN domain-containing protein [Geobacteraceae bacterium]|nr:PilN domain-containing protein [Geobacteraceae bacterium]